MNEYVLTAMIFIIIVLFCVFLFSHRLERSRIQPEGSDNKNPSSQYLAHPGIEFHVKVYESSFYVHLKDSFLLRPEYRSTDSIDDLLIGMSPAFKGAGQNTMYEDVAFDFTGMQNEINKALGLERLPSSRTDDTNFFEGHEADSQRLEEESFSGQQSDHPDLQRESFVLEDGFFDDWQQSRESDADSFYHIEGMHSNKNCKHIFSLLYSRLHPYHAFTVNDDEDLLERRYDGLVAGNDDHTVIFVEKSPESSPIAGMSITIPIPKTKYYIPFSRI